MPPPVKRFPFARGSVVTKSELEDVYNYLQEQLERLQRDISAISTTAPATDYSYQIELLASRITALETQLTVLQATVGAVPAGVTFRLEDSDNRLVVTTPSGERQIILALYP